MLTKWERYSKQGLDVASAATSLGFSAAKVGTHLGFGAARGIASSVVFLAGTTVDYALFGANRGTGVVLGGAVSAAISLAEQLAMAPILLGETVTSTSLVAAQSSIGTMSAIFPESDEASFSLASFITLVRREWNEPVLGDHLPEERYSVTEVAKALVAWGALQGVTQEWQEQNWFKALREINIDDFEDAGGQRERYDSRVHVTDDTILPQNDGQIVTADIGEAPSLASSVFTRPPGPISSRSQPRFSSIYNVSTLRRLSKIVLAGYGGAGLIFFGVPFTPSHAISHAASNSVKEARQKTAEEKKLFDAIDAAEEGASSSPAHSPPKSYSWWNVLLGRHDQEIFEEYAFSPSAVRDSKSKRTPRPSTVVLGGQNQGPRFWVLTDHGRRQIMLVLRGTMSLNELAVDLTCDPAGFVPACGSPMDDHCGHVPDENEGPGSWASFPPSAPDATEVPSSPRYEVHSGMLRMARAMGEKGKPVHSAVRDALHKNRNYELVLCGHSLGAGVAGLLALTWADPSTCLTVSSSGLPVGRRVSAYCFAPPCLVSPALSSLSSNLITSFVYSHDVVSRLSLGSIRDMTRAAVWLCSGDNGEGYVGVTKRALKWKAGFGEADDPHWFLAVRKTLEANMHMAQLFPPGRIWWAIRDGDLQPENRLKPNAASSGSSDNKVRLFEVLDVEKVFSQIVFARDMLSAHHPGHYDRVLHELS